MNNIDELLKRFASYRDFIQEHDSSILRSEFQSTIQSLSIRIIGILFSFVRLFIKPCKCDFLFLFFSEVDKSALDGVIEKIQKSNKSVKIEVFSSKLDRLKKLAFGFVPYNVPYRLCGTFSFARFIREKYNPSMVVLIEDYALYPSVLRHAYGFKLANIAHGVLANDWDHSYIDYNYYLIFGESSLNHMQLNNNLFGSTEAIITGTYYLKGFSKVGAICVTGGVIIYLSQYLNPRVRDHLEYSDSVMIAYAVANPGKKIIIKLHPLEDDEVWIHQTSHIKNITILPQRMPVSEAIKGVSIAVSAWSNSLVEAAACGCPVISIDRTNYSRNALDIDSYFPIVSDVSGFSAAVDLICENYKRYVAKARGFSGYHLHNIGCGESEISLRLMDLVDKVEVKSINIREKRNWRVYP